MHSKRLASLTAELTAPKREVRLLPAGVFRAADGSGRPKDAPAWRIDAASAAALIARFNTRADQRVIDYEHATLTAADKGGFAPAAGWFGTLEWRDPATGSGQADELGGLYAIDVEWTPQAAAMIGNREYRYLSPVFQYDRDGTVLNLLHAGLTNNPGLDGLTDLAALTAHLSAHFHLFNEETPTMDLKKLLAALALAETTSESEALAAVAALKAKADASAGQIAALTAQVSQPDPAKYVPIATVTDLQGQVAALTAEKIEREVDALLQVGLSDGRILPSMEGWARDLGKKDVAALKGYLDNASPVAALSGTQTGGKPASGKAQTHTDAEIAVMKAIGQTTEVFATGKLNSQEG
jgi:phage I-like protein